MNETLSAYKGTRYLSHVEIVHRPGERDLATKFLSLLGVDLNEARGGSFVMATIDRDTLNMAEFANFMGGSQVHSEQWEFEQALIEATREGPLAEKFSAWQVRLDRDPTSGMHTGIHYPRIADWEAVVARLEQFETEFPELAGRVRLCWVRRPGDPDSNGPLYQAFVWTDVISSGSLAIGERFELSALDATALGSA